MIGALILGLVAGGLARLFVPNDALKDMEGWRSWLVTIVVGLVGAVLGWLVFTGLFGIGDSDMFDLGGIIGAIIGAVVGCWQRPGSCADERTCNSPRRAWSAGQSVALGTSGVRG